MRSRRVHAIRAVAEDSSRLRQNVPFEAEAPHVFNGSPSVRPRLPAAATKDAQRRADVLVDATGSSLCDLRSVDVGVFQVTVPNSTYVSDYGVYDTSTVHNDVTAVVNVTFASTDASWPVSRRE